MYFQLPISLLLSFSARALAINIIDFDTCSIPYIVPRNFQRFCDRSDEYFPDLSVNDLTEGQDTARISLPANVSSAVIRNRPNLWTHEPFCVESPEANNGFCVYTNTHFANGRGISIVATPKEVCKVMLRLCC
jgi:hypothetical protein